MAKIDTKTIILGAALLGAGFYLYKQSQESGAGGSEGSGGSGSGGASTGKKAWDTIKSIFKANDPNVKLACDESYKPIGANRYLCYKLLKAPTDAAIEKYLTPQIEESENGGE